jgi:hypothetical protein
MLNPSKTDSIVRIITCLLGTGLAIYAMTTSKLPPVYLSLGFFLVFVLQEWMLQNRKNVLIIIISFFISGIWHIGSFNYICSAILWSSVGLPFFLIDARIFRALRT